MISRNGTDEVEGDQNENPGPSVLGAGVDNHRAGGPCGPGKH